MGIFKPTPRCARCGRGYPKRSSCKVCKAIVREHTSAGARKGVNLLPHKCPVDGCGLMVHGGMCPSPYH